MKEKLNKLVEYWKKGKKQKAIVIIVALLIIGVFGSITGMGDETEADSNDINYAFSDSENLTLNLTTHNDSKAVDEISTIAKKDMENNTDEESLQIINDGLYFINKNIDNLTKDNETMEKSMYYGYYIYRYIELNVDADDVSELKEKDKAVYYIGYYTYTYIKYPYRNADGTSENRIDKIKEYLKEI